MRFAPILLLSAGLLLLIMLMAGDREKGLQLLRNIVLVIAGLALMVAMFALIGEVRS